MAMAGEREGKEKSMTIKQRVRAGIKFLDKIYTRETWRPKVELRKLDLRYPNDCMLGQTDSDFASHATKLGLSLSQLYRLGFVVKRSVEDYPKLTAAWKEELRKI